MRYAMKTDYEDYTGLATADLPSEIDRKLNRAEELIYQATRNRGNPKQTDLVEDVSSGEKELTIRNGSRLEEGETVTIQDNDDSETGTVDTITTSESGADTVTLESSLTNSYSISERAYIAITDPDTRNLKERWALRKATCAQVEYWEEAYGENYDIAGNVGSFQVGNFSMNFATAAQQGGTTLAPRAYRVLVNFGLIYAGVNDRNGHVSEHYFAKHAR